MEIFRTLSGSRLYGVATPDSDFDYKAVHLPTKLEILLGKRPNVRSGSTGPKNARNSAGDVDVESFELQYYLKLAADMQTIPVEMLFCRDSRGDPNLLGQFDPIWGEIRDNTDKILNRNSKPFVGYCKGQAVRYSMRGERLATYEAVVEALEAQLNEFPGTRAPVAEIIEKLAEIPGVKIVTKEHNGKDVQYLDVFGRQVPETVDSAEALKIYQKPVQEAGERAHGAKNAGGRDNKALYHAIRIADEGISLFRYGFITFPCQNREFLMKIRAGEVDLDEILDVFDEKMEILEGIGEKSPLRAEPDREWIDDIVAGWYEAIVRA